MSAPHYCPDCRGSGADAKETAEARRRGQCDRLSYIRCWTCLGNGLDPAAYFRWTNTPQPTRPTNENP